jgi:hypothetical protein
MAKDTRYFTHDHDARHDHKIHALIKKYGVEGYGRFWIVIENMREISGYKLNGKSYVYESLAEQMKCTAEEVKQFLADCVQEFDLFVQEDGFIYSESLLTRMAKLDAMRRNNRNAAYIMHEKQGHNITKEPDDLD